MSARDTSPEIARIQLERLRGTSGARRLATAFELTSLAREFAMAGIRARHPGATREQLEHEYCAMLFGQETAARVRDAAERRRSARRSAH